MTVKKRIVISVLILVVVSLLGGFAYFYHTVSAVANVQTICDGVSVDGCDVGGMTIAEAEKAVSVWEEKLADTKLTITYDDKQDAMRLSDLGYAYADVKKAVQDAYNVGKKGSMWARYRAIRKGTHNGTDIKIEKSVTEEKFQKYLDKNEDTFVKVAKNAQLSRENGQWNITKEQKGMEVPVDKNVSALNKYLNGKWNKKDITYELDAEIAEPEYTTEDMEKVKDVLGTYTTNFGSSTFNRIQNIKNACHFINGSVVYPNETFSVMDKILPFTAENGYYEAGSYSAGEVIQSYGGGVCQVATTLYNSVLLSELQVAERNNHQMVVSYVPLSMDAAVSDTGNQDFKFVNSTKEPIYIEGYVDGYNITFTIYGCETRSSNRTIKFESEQTATIQPGKDIVTKDKTMTEGKKMVTQPAHVGYRARLWKCVYVDGELESKEQINTSSYSASARRVTVGTKKKKEKEEDKDKEKEKKKATTEEKSKNSTTQKSKETTQDTQKSTETTTQEEQTAEATEAPVE